MTEERDWESEAKQQGWNPNHKGDNAVDAKTFVEKGERIVPLLQAKSNRQQIEIDQLKRSNKEFGEYHKQQREKDQAENKRLIAELETKRAAAVTEGDGAAFVQTDRQIRDLEQQQQEVPIQQSNGLDPTAQDWLSENQWYNTNERLQIYADGVADRIVQEGYVYGSKGYFSELTRRVKDGNPGEFETQKTGSNSVEQGRQIDTESSNKAKTYENLPADAKAAATKFARDGLMSKEDYVAAYEWDE